MSEIFLEELKAKMKIDPEKVALSLGNFIREYTDKLEREGVILGLSGGIDSAVIAALCVRALGPEKTFALIMPEKDSKKEHTKDALNFAQELGIEAKLVDITPYLEELGVYKLFPLDKLLSLGKLKGALIRKAYHFYERRTGKLPFLESLSGFKDKEYSAYLAKGNAYYRAKHRLRMILLYLYGEMENRLVVGAANKSEYKIGHLVSKAAMAPTAANIGATRAPTAPTVKGNSATDSPSSFLMIILRAFPSFMISLIFSKISSPETLNSSFLFVIVFLL